MLRLSWVVSRLTLLTGSTAVSLPKGLFLEFVEGSRGLLLLIVIFIILSWPKSSFRFSIPAYNIYYDCYRSKEINHQKLIFPK